MSPEDGSRSHKQSFIILYWHPGYFNITSDSGDICFWLSGDFPGGSTKSVVYVV